MDSAVGRPRVPARHRRRRAAGLPGRRPRPDGRAPRGDRPRCRRLSRTALPGTEIAGLLEDKGSIPQVKLAMSLILDVRMDPWWEDVTVPMLERVRKERRATAFHNGFRDRRAACREIRR